MSHLTTRRIFLGAATAAAASRVWGANDTINVAIVGLGGRGTSHLGIYPRIAGARVAGLCDVNQAAREVAQASLLKATGEKAKEFTDMREAFADPGIDAVSIATPNHWHALATVWACKAGKDVYCEKPACYNIHEGQAMIDTARATKRIVQVGSQHRSVPFKIRGIESLQQGVIGKVYMGKGLCYKRRVSIGHKADSPVPAGVNWDLFLGPAPMRPFNELRFKYNWHWFWDTGNGDIGNQGVHELGITRWGLGDPAWPKTVVARGGKYGVDDDQETPNTLTANYDFGGRELVFEVRGNLTNTEGGPPPVRARAGVPAPKPKTPLTVMTGNFFYGPEGWMAMSDAGYQLYKGESNELITEEKAEPGDPTKLHMENFLSACRSRNYKELHDGVENAVMSADMVHLANISYRTNRMLTVGSGPHFLNDVEANKMITRPVYRRPYVV